MHDPSGKTSMISVRWSQSFGMKWTCALSGKSWRSALSGSTNGLLGSQPWSNKQSGNVRMSPTIFERHASRRSSKKLHSQCLWWTLSAFWQNIHNPLSTLPVWTRASCVYSVPFNAQRRIPCSSGCHVSNSFKVVCTHAEERPVIVFLSLSLSCKTANCQASLIRVYNSRTGQWRRSMVIWFASMHMPEPIHVQPNFWIARNRLEHGPGVIFSPCARVSKTKSAKSGMVYFRQLNTVSYKHQNSGSHVSDVMHERVSFGLAPKLSYFIAFMTCVRIFSKWTGPKDEMEMEWNMLGHADTFKQRSFRNFGAELLASLLQKGVNLSILSFRTPFVSHFE